MWHKLNVICSYMLAMLLGIYIATEFKFHQPVEMYRWIATSLLFAAFVLRITYKEK
jgi:hypothetical protein